MKLILFLSITFSFTAHSFCEMSLFSRIVRIEKAKLKATDVVKASNCSSKIVSSVLSFLGSAKGKISSTVFKRSFPSINISPKTISIEEISDLVKRSLTLENGLEFQSSQFLGGYSSISLNAEDRLVIECVKCKKIGSHTIKISSLNILNNISKTWWLKGSTSADLYVFKTLKNLRAGSTLMKKDYFQKIPLSSTKPEKYFTDIENIRHFRLVRNLRKGENLTESHLVASYLVSPHFPVKVKLSSQNISLSTTAIPVKRAKLGETIELINRNTKKRFIGKVIDINKVIVEL